MTKESHLVRSEEPIPKERALEIVPDSPDILLSQFASIHHQLIEEKSRILSETPEDKLIREEIRVHQSGELVSFDTIES